MRRGILRFGWMAAALLTLSAGAAQAQTRIMPLGDSITGSPGCWRALLWQRLQMNGFTNIDFVGTLPPQGCGFTYDGENEGHGGFLAINIANQNQLVGWLAATNPHVVIMHLGTNDVWSSLPTANILAAFTTLVGQMRANNPSMKILVAQIIPMDPARSCSTCDQGVIALNNAIPGWAAGLSTAQSPITVVDQWTGFSVFTDTYDGVHPNAAGDQRISDAWYGPLSAVLSGQGTPTPTNRPTATPTTRPTATPTTRPTSTPTTRPTATPTATSTPTTRPTATPTATPTTSSSTTYQMESGTIGGGTTVDANHTGFTGTGFVNFPANGGFAQVGSVNGGGGGAATLRFRFALGASGSRTGQLVVNGGAAQNITFVSTGAWTTWVTMDVAVSLTAGSGNTVRLQSTGQDLGNVDQFQVLASGTPTPTPTPTMRPTATPTGSPCPTVTAFPVPNPAVTPGNAQVTLTWPGIPGTWTVSVLRGTTAGGPYTTVAAGLAQGTTSYVDLGLTNGTTYFYRITFRQSFCNGQQISNVTSGEVSATPTAGSTPTPTATTRPTPTPTTRPTPTPGGGVTAQVIIQNDFGSGYCAWIVISNPTTQAITWNITLTIEGTVTNLWNGIWTQNGDQLNVRGVAWNATLGPGQSDSNVGFCANR